MRSKNELVGLITPRELIKYLTQSEDDKAGSLKEIMCTDYLTISPNATTAEVVNLLAKTRASCVLVTEGEHLAGLISESDVVQVAKMTNIFKK